MSVSRFRLSELSLKRIFKGLMRRFYRLPHLISWEISSISINNRQNLLKFKNLHLDETCILLCNGPSLKSTNFQAIKNHTVFGLNRIYLFKELMGSLPSYYVAINKLVLSQFSDEIENLRIPKFLNWESRGVFKSEFSYFVYPGLFGSVFGKSINNSINPSATVTYAALQIIYYMGFKKVIILGLDHNFNFSGGVNELQRVDEDNNHFVKNYFPKGSKWETPDLTSSEYFYSIARKVFEREGREIIDCTPGGKCEVFKKSKIENELPQ